MQTISITKTTASPEQVQSYCFDGSVSRWSMSFAERCAFIHILNVARAEVAIEIGTRDGGSLREIAARSKRVFSIDIDPDVKRRLAGEFPAVEFLVGDSRTVVPELVRRLNAESAKVGFVHIDGDHTAEGVRADVDNILGLVPRGPLYIVMHDSFNPECREGMLQGAWDRCAHLRALELDAVPGTYFEDGGRLDRQMWGGLGLAILDAGQKADAIPHAQEHALYEVVRRASGHGGGRVRGLAQRLKKKLRGNAG